MERPALVGAALYLYVSLLGVIYNSIVTVNRGFNPVGYYHINDFLLGGLRHPYILILIVVAVFLSGIYGFVTISTNYLIECVANADEIRQYLARSQCGSIVLKTLGWLHWGGRLAAHWVLMVVMLLLLALPIYFSTIAREDKMFAKNCEAWVTIATKQEKQETAPIQPITERKEINNSAKPEYPINGYLIGSTERYIFVSDNAQVKSNQITKILPVDSIQSITVKPSYDNPSDRWVCLALR